MAEDEILEPTKVWTFDELPESLRAEKIQRDVERALLIHRARQEFLARHFPPKWIVT